ncbi:50S ribosomal protein L6 [Candidatus Curtissbacteria bacterium]|nr:50S ribosomal protein L6 [Candidatus Curtissbacteria bacterium]
MSKIGNKPISIPQGVTVEVGESIVRVFGPKGELTFPFRDEVAVGIQNQQVVVSRKAENKFSKALHGLTRSIIANMIQGVTGGHEKTLEIIGVGYKAQKQGENLVLNVGYSHPVVITQTQGIEIDTKENKITVSGADKALVGEIAAKIRRVRPPEPYKGKGIKYFGEQIRRKAGKALKTGGTA